MEIPITALVSRPLSVPAQKTQQLQRARSLRRKTNSVLSSGWSLAFARLRLTGCQPHFSDSAVLSCERSLSHLRARPIVQISAGELRVCVMMDGVKYAVPC